VTIINAINIVITSIMKTHRDIAFRHYLSVADSYNPSPGVGRFLRPNAGVNDEIPLGFTN
jgi:hypothetical protein